MGSEDLANKRVVSLRGSAQMACHQVQRDGGHRQPGCWTGAEKVELVNHGAHRKKRRWSVVSGKRMTRVLE